MPSIGNISATFTANVQGFSKNVGIATKAMENFAIACRKVPKEMRAAFSAITNTISRNSVSMNKNLTRNAQAFGDWMHRMETGVKRVEQSTGDSTKRINKYYDKLNGVYGQVVQTMEWNGKEWVETNKKITTSTQESFGHMLKAMLNFKTFAMKIIHYITFSIGVQLVMGIRQAISSAIEQFTEFEKAIYQAASVSGYLSQSFGRATTVLSNFATESVQGTVFTAGDASKALYDLASAGYDVVAMAEEGESGMENFRQMMDYATATATELREAVYSVTVAIKQFNLTLDDTEMVTDTFTAAITNSFLTQQKLANAMKYVGVIAGILGQRIQDTTAAIATLSNTGMEGGQIGQRLNMVFTKLLKPTDEAKEMLEGMGLSLTDLNPRFYSLVTVLEKLRAVQFGAAEASAMFRARTAASAVALVESTDEISTYIKLLKASQGITSDIAEEMKNTQWGTFAQMQQAFYQAALDMGESLKPILKSIADFIKGPLINSFKTMASVIMGLAPILEFLVVTLISYVIYAKLAAKWSAIVAAMQALFAAKAKIAAIWCAIMKNNLKYLNASLAVTAAKFMVLSGFLMALFRVLSGSGTAIDTLAIALIGVGFVVSKLLTQLPMLSTAFAAMLGPIGWIIAGVGALVAIVSSFIGKSEEQSEELKQVRSVLKNLKVAYSEQDSVVSKYKDSIKSLNLAIKEQIRLKGILLGLEQAGQTDTDKYSDTLVQLSRVNKDIYESEEEVIKFTTYLINSLKDTNSVVSDGISYYQRYYDAESQLIDVHNQLSRVDKDILKKEHELADVRSIYTTDSEEFLSIQNELLSLEDDRTSMLSRLTDLSDTAAENEAKYNEVLEKTNKEYREAIEQGKLFYDLRVDLINQIERMNKLEGEQIIFQRTEADWNKILEEGTKRLKEEKWKLLEIELKRYKLQKDKSSKIDEMFEALAKEGMLTKEVIDSYVDKEKAEGEAIKTGVKFAKVLDQIETDEELTDWIESYVDYLGQGKKEAEALKLANQDVGNVELLLTGADEGAYQVVMDFAMATHEAEQAIDKAGDTIGDFSEDLVDNELASYEVISAYNDYMETLHNLDVSVEDTREEHELLKLALKGVAQTASEMWVALSGFPKVQFPEFDLAGYESKFDSFKKELSGFDDAWNQLGYPKWVMPDNIEIEGEIPNIIDDEWLASQGFTGDQIEFLRGKFGVGLDTIRDILINEFSMLPSDIPEGLITKDWLKEQGLSQKDIDDLQLRGGDFIDFDTITRGSEAFEEALYNINKQTGYFTDKSADSATVLDAYLKYVSQWVPETEAYSSATAIAAITMKELVERGEDEDEILRIVGGDFKQVAKYGQSGLSSISSDADTVNKKLQTTIDRIGNIRDELIKLGQEEFIIHLVEEVERRTKDKDDDGGDGGFFDTLGNMWDFLNPGKRAKNAIEDARKKWEELHGESGIIPKLKTGITETTQPIQALIGENGAEAVVPLEGANRKYGKQILEKIIPKYFPDLTPMQTGGVASVNNALTKIASIKTLLEDISSINDLLESINSILSTGINIIIPTDGLPIKNVTQTPATDTGLPFRRGTTETVEQGEGGGAGASSSANGGIFNALVTVRQGGKKINMEIYLQATELADAITLFNTSMIETIIPKIEEAGTGFKTNIEDSLSGIKSSADAFHTRVGDAADVLVLGMIGVVDAFKKAVEDVTPIKVEHTHTTIFIPIPPMKRAKGVIAGLQKGIATTRGPQFAMIGERGPEAVVPLAGAFKDRGRDILQHIIPTYFPEMTRQEGGISNIDNSSREEFNVLGPVTVNAIANVDDMVEEFKYRYRNTR